MKMYKFRLKFYWHLFPNVQLKYSSISSDNGLTPSRRKAIIWTNDELVYWRIYAPLVLSELNVVISQWRHMNVIATQTADTSTVFK